MRSPSVVVALLTLSLVWSGGDVVIVADGGEWREMWLKIKRDLATKRKFPNGVVERTYVPKRKCHVDKANRRCRSLR